MRQGLLANCPKDDALCVKTENIAALLAGEGAPRDRLALGRLAAEAQLTVLRVPAAQIRLLLEDALAVCLSPGPESAACGCAPPPMVGTAYLRVRPELIKFNRLRARGGVAAKTRPSDHETRDVA
jgi:hypothetical protein